MNITILHEVTDEVVQAFQRLVPQLSTSAAAPTREEIQAMVDSDCSIVFIARDPDEHGPIIGSLTLIVFRVPTGVRAWIEDVIVDEAARGKGLGETLTRAALEEARRRGTKTVDLTSRPTREAANRLYVRVGFVLRQSNLYRYDLTKEAI
jgi:ribosomal protein S18 acetylase RimI-like enzyme